VQSYLLEEVDRKIDDVAAVLPPSLTLTDFETFEPTGEPGGQKCLLFSLPLSRDGEIFASNLVDTERSNQPECLHLTYGWVLNNPRSFTRSSLDRRTEWRLHTYTLRIIARSKHGRRTRNLGDWR
jgi:hypothetical protein